MIKSSNHIIKLIQWHDERIKADKKLIKEILFQLGEEAFLDLLKVQLADSRAQNPDYIKEKEKQLESLYEIYKEIKENNECFLLKDLAVNGQDLISLGIKEGKEIGKILKSLLELVIDKPNQNNKEALLSYIKENYIK